MKMKLTATSMGISKSTKTNSVGIGAATGVMLQIRMGSLTQCYVLNKTASLGANSAGSLGFTILGTDWFTLSDPKNKAIITDLNHNLVQIEISSTFGFSKIDVKFIVYDQNNQPFFTAEKVNIPARGFNTSTFTLRARLKKINTLYHIKYKKPIN